MIEGSNFLSVLVEQQQAGFRQVTTMRNSRSKIRTGCLRGILGVSVLALLSGCGWFGGSTPADMTKARPGAERDVPVSATLPPPPANQQYDASIAPVDSMRDTPKIGSIVPESGGQKAQLEKQEKEEQARDAEERENREKADKAAKEAEDAEKAASGKQATTSGDKASEPPTQPVAAPPAPVTSAPVPPPAPDAAPGLQLPGTPVTPKPPGSQ
jgi:hypothetical protein